MPNESDPVHGTHTSGSYAIAQQDEAARREAQRLDALGRVRDPHSRQVLEAIGLAPGWKCLEVGGGGGSLARWMAERVGPQGQVLSTDIDLRFHTRDAPEALEVRLHDITRDPLPRDHFDLSHCRAVLQHVAERERALDRMIEATRPGGFVVCEDSDFQPFEMQPLPEPFGSVARTMIELSARARDWDRNVGRRLLALLRERGLVELEAVGQAWTMHGGRDSAEWWVLAMEHAGPALVAAQAVEADELADAIAQARAPGFAVLSPLSMSVRGRKPR